MSRKPFIVIILLGAGAILALAFQSWDRSPARGGEQVARSGPNIVSELNQEETEAADPTATLEAVVESNARILAQLERMDARLTNLETEKTEQEDVLADRERQQAMLQKAKSNPELIARYNEVQQRSREQRRSKLGERFEAEPVDYAWAEEVESDMKQTVEERIGERAVLEDVSCRSSMCKMVLDLPSAVDGPIESMELMELEIDLLSGLSSGDNGPIQAHHWLEDDGFGGLRYVTFAARPGHNLPPPDDPFQGMDIEEAIDFLESEP